MTFGLWSTPEWAEYCLAENGGPPRDNNTPDNIIVPLGPESEMWSRIRHGHQAAIRRAERWMECEIVSGSGLAFEIYERMHKLEVRSHGHEPRPQRTYDLMNEWLGKYGLLFLAHQMDQYIGAVYVYVYGEGSYYGSSTRLLGCIDGAGKPWPTTHFLLWSAMKHLAASGHKWFDMGQAHTDGIGHFKRGFIHGEVAERKGTRPLSGSRHLAAQVRSLASPQKLHAPTLSAIDSTRRIP